MPARPARSAVVFVALAVLTALFAGCGSQSMRQDPTADTSAIRARAHTTVRTALRAVYAGVALRVPAANRAYGATHTIMLPRG